MGKYLCQSISEKVSKKFIFLVAHTTNKNTKALSRQVVIEDVCEGKCEENQACHAEYPSGKYECDCEFGCHEGPFSPLCSDRCEQFIKPCFLKQQTCEDGLDRNKLISGMCRRDFRDAPAINRFNSEIIEDEGVIIQMTSGLVEEDAPHILVEWTFISDDGQYHDVKPASDPWELTVGPDTTGLYTVTLTPCRDPSRAVVNKVSVGMTDEDPSLPPNVVTIYHTCSIYPGGGIDQFDGQSAFYDLACTHVLAADVAPAGNIAAPWYIYGTFDEHDGNAALSAMTFYVGRNIFEVQRGWIVNINGEKMKLNEGEVQEVPGGSGCTVVFKNRHLVVECDAFFAYYDGVMSGHLALKPGVSGPPYPEYVKKGWNFGLCNDGNSGFRPNWQVGNTAGDCKVDTEKPGCEDEAEEGCDLTSPAVNNVEWTTCGGGATLGCGEIHCGGGTPTAAQTCALEQAKRMGCALKQNQKEILESDGQDEACPKDVCLWKEDVISRGCFQENPPFKDCVFGL